MYQLSLTYFKKRFVCAECGRKFEEGFQSAQAIWCEKCVILTQNISPRDLISLKKT